MLKPDVAGHVIHHDFGGGTGVAWDRPVNIVPMSNHANRFRYYNLFEREARDQVRRGNTVCVAIRFTYGDPDHPARPRSWTVHMMVGYPDGTWNTNYLNLEFHNEM